MQSQNYKISVYLLISKICTQYQKYMYVPSTQILIEKIGYQLIKVKGVKVNVKKAKLLQVY